MSTKMLEKYLKESSQGQETTWMRKRGSRRLWGKKEGSGWGRCRQEGVVGKAALEPTPRGGAEGARAEGGEGGALSPDKGRPSRQREQQVQAS